MNRNSVSILGTVIIVFALVAQNTVAQTPVGAVPRDVLPPCRDCTRRIPLKTVDLLAQPSKITSRFHWEDPASGMDGW